METFFDGSPEKVVAALLGESAQLSDEELDRIARRIDQARRDAKKGAAK
jgi:hypothetical protein